MKLFVLLLALIAFTAAQPVRKSNAEVDRVQAACVKRFNIPDEIAEKSRHADVLPIEVFEVVLCFFRDLGAWSDSTGLNLNNIMQLLPENVPHKQKLNESLKNCLDAKREGETPLNWAYRNLRCFDILIKAKSSTEIVEH